MCIQSLIAQIQNKDLSNEFYREFNNFAKKNKDNPLVEKLVTHLNDYSFPRKPSELLAELWMLRGSSIKEWDIFTKDFPPSKEYLNKFIIKNRAAKITVYRDKGKPGLEVCID